jgi:excisionase family DNA binding protein
MLRIKLMEMSHFTVEEAAKEIGVSVQRVRAIISSGYLHASMRAGVWFIDKSDVEEYASRVRKAGRPRKWQDLEVRALTPEEEAERERKDRDRSELATIRADYEWFKACESMPLDFLRDNASTEAEFPDERHRGNEHKRRLQAMIVLERRESN